MSVWLIIIAGGIVTYSSRLSFIAFGDRITLPNVAERALAYVAPAAFAGISIPLVLGADGLSNPLDASPRIIAALVAIGAVWWKKSLPLSIVAGMATLWLLTWLT